MHIFRGGRPDNAALGIRVHPSITRTVTSGERSRARGLLPGHKGRGICGRQPPPQFADKPRFNFAAIQTGRRRLILFYIVVRCPFSV
ncbi:hypothetical protein MTP99_008567 [Tenebrio molitor]|nr:hypothetical protein MTP99_008567 [Tenebrio molitor]